MHLKLSFLLFFLPLAMPSFGQFDSLLLKWQKLEQAYIADVGINDLENCIINAQKMVDMCEEHFGKEDSVFAYAIYRFTNSCINAGYYNRAKQFAEGHLPWIKEFLLVDKKELPKIYASLFLLHGNATVYLADVYAHKDSLSKDSINLSVLSIESRREQALSYYNQAIGSYLLFLQFRPKHIDGLMNMVYVCNKKAELLGRYMGDLKGSKEALEQALLYGKDFNTYRMLGVVNGLLYNSQAAAQMFEQALKIEPKSKAILYNLEVAYNAMSTAASQKKLKKKYAKIAHKFRKRWQAIDPNYLPE